MSYTPAPCVYPYIMAPNYALYARGYGYAPGTWAVLDPSMTKRTFDEDAAVSGTKRAAPPNYHMRNMHAERQERLAAYSMQALADALPPPTVVEPSPMLPWLQEAENERQRRRRQDAERQWAWQQQRGDQEQQRQQQALLLEAEAARRQRREGRERSEGSACVCASGFVRVN